MLKQLFQTLQCQRMTFFSSEKAKQPLETRLCWEQTCARCSG